MTPELIGKKAEKLSPWAEIKFQKKEKIIPNWLTALSPSHLDLAEHLTLILNSLLQLEDNKNKMLVHTIQNTIPM
jgi:hypothetical protein